MMSKPSKTMHSEPRDVAIAGGKSLAVRVWGSLKKTARPQEHWIALHGHGDDSDTLDNHIAPLVLNKGAGGAAAVVCMDMLAHNDEPSVFADDVLALADALGWGQFSILSHSPEAALVSQLVAARATDRVAFVCPLEAHHPNMTDPFAIEKALDEELESEEEEEFTQEHLVRARSLNAWADVYFALCPKDKHLDAGIEDNEYRDIWFARAMSEFEII